MKKTILKVQDFGDSKNILLFALATAESDLRVCLLLNRALGINLSLAEGCEVIIKKEKVTFRRYTFDDGGEGSERFDLFVNKNGLNYLIPEVKKIDLVLMIQSDGFLSALEQKVINLKSEPEFTAIYKLDYQALKSFGRLTV